MSDCKCDLRTRLVGDGCAQCNPQMTIDLLQEQVQEQADEIARLRLTDAEREAVEKAAWYVEAMAGGDLAGTVPPTLRGLLDRLK